MPKAHFLFKPASSYSFYTYTIQQKQSVLQRNVELSEDQSASQTSPKSKITKYFLKKKNNSTLYPHPHLQQHPVKMENAEPALNQKLRNNFLNDLNFLKIKDISSKCLELIWPNSFEV